MLVAVHIYIILFKAKGGVGDMAEQYTRNCSTLMGSNRQMVSHTVKGCRREDEQEHL